MEIECFPNIRNTTTITNTPQNDFIHCDTVGEANLELLRRQEHCDVVFEVGLEKKAISCHKTFLVSRSPVFQKMFSERWERSDPVILPDVEPATFEAFIEFVYGDVFKNSIPMAVKLFKLGHKYDVKPLVQKCLRLLSHVSQDIQLENAIEIFCLARRYSLKKLMDQAGELMACFFEDLSKEVAFRDIDEETLIYLLRRDDLHVEEWNVFQIVLSWARDKVGRGSCCWQVLENFIPLIRFTLMSPEEFMDYVFSTQTLPRDKVVPLYVYFSADESIKQREARSKRLPYSRVPRKKLLTLMLYETATTVPTNDDTEKPIFESLEFQELQGLQDNLELCYTYPVGTTCYNVRLVSLLLQGFVNDSLKRYWNFSMLRDSKLPVCVSIERLDSSGGGKNIFMKSCVISEGQQSLKISPQIELANGVTYRVKVQLETSYIVLIQPDQRNGDSSFDIFTGSKLIPTISDPNLGGTFQVGRSEVIPPASDHNRHKDSEDNCCSGPQTLHIVRGLIISY